VGPQILIACKYRILGAGIACFVFMATIALGQTTVVESKGDSQLPLAGEPLPKQSTFLDEALTSVRKLQVVQEMIVYSAPSH
jgi:hypothetical protein